MRSGLALTLHQSLPLITAATIASGLLFNGFNSAIGKTASCLLACALATVLLADRRPSMSFWLAIRMGLGALCLAVAWLIVIAVTPGMAFAPDLALTDILGVAGCIAALLAGCLMGLDGLQTGGARLLIVFFAILTFLIGLALRELGADGTLDYWSVVRQGRLAGTIGNINVTAAIAGGIALLAVGLALDRTAGRSRRKRRDRETAMALALFVCAILALVTLALTAARFPTVALVLVAAAFGMSEAMAGRFRLRTLAKAVMAIGFLAICVTIANTDLLMERFTRLDSEGAVRTMMWRHYFDLWLESPHYGYGPGAFSEINTHRLDTPQLARALWSVNSPHNVLLQLLLKGGWPYALLIGVAAWSIARPIVRHLAGPKATFEDRGVGAFLMLVLACSLVDIALDVPAAVQLMAFLAGTLWMRSIRQFELPLAHDTAPRGGERKVGVRPAR